MVIFDGHVHIYPFFDLGAALKAALDNLTLLAAPHLGPEKVDLALLLAERADCFFFKALQGGKVSLPAPFKLEEAGPGHALITDLTRGAGFYLLPGRQIVSSERIEVLALGADMEVHDGLPLDYLLVNIRESGAVPGICWSPGKWIFKRGRIIAELIETCGPKDLVLLDTGIRPAFSPQPVLMSRAQRYGLNVLAGTDPFPLAGEEQRIGSYATISHLVLNRETPAESLKQALTAPVSRAGRRLAPWKVLSRLRANAKLRKTSKSRE